MSDFSCSLKSDILKPFAVFPLFRAIFSQSAKSRGLSVVLLITAVALIWLSGATVGTAFNKDEPLTASALEDKQIYLLEPVTNMVRLVPAKLNNLTGVAEPCGAPAYYTGVETGTNHGPVAAIRTKKGAEKERIMLKPFPLKTEAEKERAEEK
jgi:hypothetical protein